MSRQGRFRDPLFFSSKVSLPAEPLNVEVENVENPENLFFYKPGPRSRKKSPESLQNQPAFFPFINLARGRERIVWQKSFLLERPVWGSGTRLESGIIENP